MLRVALPSVASRCPGPHIVNGVHAMAFVPELKLPLWHGSQIGCTELCIRTKYPGRQWQIGLRTLLPGSIWTCVVASQLVCSLQSVPPSSGLKYPGTQFVQTVEPMSGKVPAEH